MYLYIIQTLHFSEFHYDERRHYGKCYDAECSGEEIVIMSITMFNAIEQNVVMMNVVAPKTEQKYKQ